MKKLEFKTEKFDLGPRHSLGIVAYIAASMGYSKEEIKQIVGGNFAKLEGVLEFHKILSEPLDNIQQAEYKEEVKDLLGPFNLVEQIQKVINLILEKSDCDDPNLHMSAMVYKNSPFKFDNLVNKLKEEPKMTAREEYLRDEAEIEKFDEERLEELRQLDELVKQRVEEELQKRENLEKERLDEKHRKEMFEETMARINGDARFSSQANVYNRPFYSRPFPHQQPRPDFTPGFNPSTGEYATSEIEELNQAIEILVRLRDKLILDNNEQNLNERNKESKEPKEPQEQSAPFEPVKFTEEQRQHQREILGDLFGSTSRYNQIANEKVRKLSEYSIRHSTKHLFDEALRNRTEEEAMISRSIEIYPSTNLCKDSLNAGNFKNPSDFKELFSFVRVDGDRMYRINDSSVQPWNRSKPLGTIRMISENFGLFTSTKITIKVNEDNVEEYVDEYLDNPYVILDAVNSKYGLSITPNDINVEQVLGTPNLETPYQYLFRHSYYRAADEVKASLKESRNKFIKGLVRDSAIVVLNDKELYDWIKGENPTNS
jgi:hypothetical protein